VAFQQVDEQIPAHHGRLEAIHLVFQGQADPLGTLEGDQDRSAVPGDADGKAIPDMSWLP
jgi:hypothetical protein